MGPNGALAYSKVSNQTGAESADPHRLIQMLIDGAIEKMNRAKYFMKQNKVAQKGEQISWAISIIGGLKASLNSEAGGQLAQNLDNLYDFCTHHLVLANAENSIDKLDEALVVMQNIKEGWDGIRADALNMMKDNNGQTQP